MCYKVKCLCWVTYYNVMQQTTSLALKSTKVSILHNDEHLDSFVDYGRSDMMEVQWQRSLLVYIEYKIRNILKASTHMNAD